MHRTVINVQTGEITEVPLTEEEQAAYDAAQAQAEIPAEIPPQS
jgi:hypothetical protein